MHQRFRPSPFWLTLQGLELPLLAESHGLLRADSRGPDGKEVFAEDASRRLPSWPCRLAMRPQRLSELGSFTVAPIAPQSTPFPVDVQIELLFALRRGASWAWSCQGPGRRMQAASFSFICQAPRMLCLGGLLRSGKTGVCTFGRARGQTN